LCSLCIYLVVVAYPYLSIFSAYGVYDVTFCKFEDLDYRNISKYNDPERKEPIQEKFLFLNVKI